jgi:hypothetical protein
MRPEIGVSNPNQRDDPESRRFHDSGHFGDIVEMLSGTAEHSVLWAYGSTCKFHSRSSESAKTYAISAKSSIL